MQSLNIILTRHYLFYQSSDLSLEETILEVNQVDPDLLIHFTELLSALNLPRNTSINLMLDRTLISFFCFNLPPVSRRKLDKILQYELADILIDDVENYFYDYHFANSKVDETQIGIYLIKKELVNQILQIVKSNGLELRSILPLDNLLDEKIQDRYQPENEIIVAADRYDTSMLVYKNRFLVGIAGQSVVVNQGSADPDPNFGVNIEELNWKIKAIGLKDNEIQIIRIADEATAYLRLTPQNELVTILQERNGVPSSLCADLIHGIQFGRSNYVNLLKSNFLILKEVRKHIKKIGFLLVILTLGSILYISSIIYQNQKNREHHQELENILADAVHNYLPKGTSNSDALRTLKNQVAELKALRLENQKYVRREYIISQQLNELSGIKRQIPSLTLSKYLYTEQSIRIQGEVSTFTEYDRLKNSLQSIFSKEYSLRYNQKSVGDEKIEFTVTIRPN